jgi:Ca-activated chloride channel family protein
MSVRALIIGLAVAAVALAALASGGSSDKTDSGGGTSAGKAPPGSIRVTFLYSPEKEPLLLPLVRRFNGRQTKIGGRPVFVDAQNVSSGEAESKIAAGKLRPVAWSPASSLWGRLLNFEADRHYVGDTNNSIVRTPLVIAMWEPLARTLGWPKKRIGFADVLALAVSKAGWAAYGKPQYGQFKLGHTNPDFSTSGLSAVAAEYYAATGKREGLTEADLAKPAARRKIRAIERSIVHYGDTTLFFADQLERNGPAYASAVAMEEATLIDFNKRRHAAKLVAIYPREGTFFSDNPFIVLDAPWVSAQQREGAAAFEGFLKRELTPQRAAAAGFRPGDPATKALPPIDTAHGADPAQPATVLALPEPKVLARLKTLWRADRKPANVMLVVDTSGSMGEENKLAQVKQGLGAFFRALSPRDRVGLATFSTSVRIDVPIGEFAQNRGGLRSEVEGLLPQGETAVYDATSSAVGLIHDLNDDSRINAVVVLTDGQDTSSSLGPAQLVRDLQGQSESEGTHIRVFTIAYGAGADRPTLDRIAAASGGKGFAGNPDDIESVYKSISSFF